MTSYIGMYVCFIICLYLEGKCGHRQPAAGGWRRSRESDEG